MDDDYSVNVSAIDGRKLRTSFNGVNPLDQDGPATEFYVRCVFPINGLYGFIPRVLYYVLLVFAVFARSHEWLAAGALASAMSFGGFAAIHAFILVLNYSFTSHRGTATDPYLFADLDIYAIWAILTAAWYITVPLLSWSSTLRKLNARHVVVCWSLLIAAGVICAAIPFLKAFPHHRYFELYWQNAAAICSSVSGNDSSELSYEDRVRPYILSGRAWNYHNCTTQCSNFSPNMIMRPGVQMVPLLQGEFVNWVRLPLLHSKIDMTELSLFLLPPVILQYVYSLWSDRKSPAEARNHICVLITGRHSKQRMRRYVAVTLAVIIYIHALLMLLICPLLFFFNIIFNEWSLAWKPQDEPVTAVGQWSPVVSVILVVVGVSLAQTHRNSQHVRHYLLEIPMQLFQNQRRGHHRKHWPRKRSTQQRKTSRRPSLHIAVVQLGPALLFRPISRILKHLQNEWHDFRHWIHDPIELSHQSYRKTSDEQETAPRRSVTPPNVQYVRLDQKSTSLQPEGDDNARMSVLSSLYS